MVDISVTNVYTNDGDNVLYGTAGEDRLIYTYTLVDVGGVALSTTPLVGGGYSGLFDGYYTNNVYFNGFEHFTINMAVDANDTLNTGSGDDIINAAGGNDVVNSGSGNDQVDGGSGHDFWYGDLSALTADLTINLNTTSYFGSGGFVRNFEGFNITSGSGNDALTGFVFGASNSSDVVNAGAGNDTITLVIGGWDSANGGTGDDRLIVTNNYTDHGGVATLNFRASDGETGYTGQIDGYYTNNIDFTGIEHFTFTDNVAGNDNFVSGDGNDSLTTGDGNDTMNSGQGYDTIDGGAGRDYWTGDTSFSDMDIQIDLNGPSSLLGTASVQNVEGFNITTGDGNDALTGFVTAESNYSDVVNAGGGNDTISLWIAGWDTAEGGDGSDRLIVVNDILDNSGVHVNNFTDQGGGSYSGQFDGYYTNNIDFSGIEHFTYTDLRNGNDIIHAGMGNDSLSGGGGDDLLNSGSGNDTVDGGEGTDRWQADHSALSEDILIDLNDISTLPGGGTLRNTEAMSLNTGSGADVLRGHMTSGQVDVIDAGGGNDTIDVWIGGWDTIVGGTGSDRLIVTNDLAGYGGVGTLNFAETEGQTGYTGQFDGYYTNNIDFSGIEHFTFTDNADGNDNIRTGAGDDSLSGGGGNDTLNSGSGNDTVDGGEGNDFWYGDHSALSEDIVINLNGVSTLPGGGTLQNVEGMNVQTGSGNDSLTGHETTDFNYSDVVNAGAGDDEITLFIGGWDNAAGGTGSDRLIITNTMVGYGGTSVLNFAETADETGYSGQFDAYYTNNIDFSGIEHFTFIDSASGNDNIRTGAGDDSLSGGGGNDTLNSGSGNDTVDGGEGNDFWYGDHSALTQNIVIDLNGVSTLPGGGTLQNVEGMNVQTGSGNDSLTGHDSTDFNYSDVIASGAGDDRIELQVGGWDNVAGGVGNDTLIVENNLSIGGAYMSVTAGADGYSGQYDAYYTNNIDFTGIENFGFYDFTNANDNIATGDGSDTLSGGGGNDTLYAGAGNDTVDGGDGNDRLDGAAGNDLINAGLGTDTVIIHDDFANITLGGTSGTLVINSADGQDTISGAEYIQFNDQLVAVTDLGDFLDQVIIGTPDADSLTGAEGNDTITGLASDDTLSGLAGADSIEGGEGDDAIYGGDDNDTLAGGAGNDTVDGGNGSDTVRIADTFANATGISGTTASLTLTTADGTDTLNNVEFVQFNDQTVAIADLAALVDTAITGTPDADSLTGTEGVDTILGLAGNDTLSGLAGADSIEGGDGDDAIYGGDDNDTLAGDAGNDTVDGGNGSDTVRIADTFANATGISGTTASLTLTTADGTDTLNNVEFVQFNDQTVAIADLAALSNQTLVGTPGNDTLTGGAGDDTISGLDGNDRLDGAGGDDSILGGDGVDTLIGGDGDDMLFGGSTEADLRDVIYGGNGNDSLDGGYGNDELRGDAGVDTITGSYGVDSIFGGDGDDVLTGQAWSDLIFGGNDDDFINGGFGYDRVNGGSGADRFFHIGIFDHGSDWIQDYNYAEGDVLQFGQAGTRDQFQINYTETTDAGAAGVEEAFVIYRPTGQILWALVDGGAQDEINLLMGGVTYDLTA